MENLNVLHPIYKINQVRYFVQQDQIRS